MPYSKGPSRQTQNVILLQESAISLKRSRFHFPPRTVQLSATAVRFQPPRKRDPREAEGPPRQAIRHSILHVFGLLEISATSVNIFSLLPFQNREGGSDPGLSLGLSAKGTTGG